MIVGGVLFRFYLAAPLLRQTVAVIGCNGEVKLTLTTRVFIRSVLLCLKLAITAQKYCNPPFSHLFYISKTHFEGHLRQFSFQSILHKELHFYIQADAPPGYFDKVNLSHICLLLCIFQFAQLIGPVDKSKKTAETHSGFSRIINLGIAKDGILPSA